MSTPEDELRNAVMNVICNAFNFPKVVSAHILGRDMGPLGNKIVVALLPLFAAARVAALEEAAVWIENTRINGAYPEYEDEYAMADAFRAAKEETP